MKIIVGLGNPGLKYEKTRHNAGFWVVDALAGKHQARCDKPSFKALIAEVRIGNEKVILCKPQTYMNLSGESVRQVVDYYSSIDINEDFIVIYDEMDFNPGTVKLRAKGSAGGHNGMKSIIQHLGTDVFPRVRLGIGRPSSRDDVLHHVLSSVRKEEETLMGDMVQKACEAVEFAILNSFTLAMNRYNG